MHSYAAETNEDAFYLTGMTERVDDPTIRAQLEQQFQAERSGFDPKELRQQTLFRFRIDSVLLTRTTGHGDPNPLHEVWQTPSG